MKKNDIYTAEITAYTSEGMGICKINDMAVFVPESAVGDLLEIKIVKVMKNYAYARKERIISASPERVPSDCPKFPVCGGCDFRHISYEAELRFKKQRVADVLHHITGIDLEPEEMIGADNINSYRNKAQFPVKLYNSKPELGFYRERSHDIIPVENCLIQSPDCEKIIIALKNWMERYNVLPYDEVTLSGVVRHLFTRQSSDNGDILVCIITNTEKFPHKSELIDILREASGKITGIVQCVNKLNGNKILGDKYITLWGRDFIFDKIGNLKFKISVPSFFQVNTAQATKLYQRAKDYAELTGNEHVIDLYCGTGTIGLFMADRAKSVFGIEIIDEAVKDARLNAERNGIANAEFITGDATKFDGNKAQNEDKVVFVDPPRKGLNDELIKTIVDMEPLRVVYVSCDPATMARDLKTFIELGFRPIRCTAVDMFPRTRHVETVVLLSKGEIDSKKIRVEFSMEGMDMSGFQKDATYGQIKERVLEQTGLKVSSLYIAQVKQKHGIIERENYNKPKSENARQPQCPPEKEAAISEALKFFGMI